MKFYKLNKIKSLVISSALTISLLFTGCSNTTQSENSNNSTSSKNNTNISIESTNDSNKDSDISNEVPKGSVEATVDRVVDGDTMKLKLKDSGEIVTLRLLLVDTPESVKKGVDPQPYSLEASDFAKKTLSKGDKVYIEYDEGDKTDKYDRHLGYLWFYSKEDSSWKMFNEAIISKGYARVGYVYSQKRHLDKFYLAQDKAKTAKLNIWSVPGYVTDKGYDVDAYNSNKNSSSNNSNTSSNQVNSATTVYANGGSSSSNKYHSTKNAHDMKGSIKMSEEEAKSSGYVPCGICY